MRVMSDSPGTTDEASDETRRRDHLRVIADGPVAAGEPPARPRSIGRVIAQTALIADGAISRRAAGTAPGDARGVGRLLGRFR